MQEPSCLEFFCLSIKMVVEHGTIDQNYNNLGIQDSLSFETPPNINI